jgi:hypothetical protein
MTRKLRLLPQLAALIAATILAACGGGETAGVGSGGTGGGPTSSIPTVTGGITGFGSVVVDGTIWDERNAVIDTEVDPRQAAVPAELAIGDRVEITSTTAGIADRIRVEATVSGVVSEVTAAATPPQFKVAGQTVRLNTNPNAGPITLLEGYTSLAQMAVNDIVEVHGTPVFDATLNRYVIQASRVEKLASLPAGMQRIAGVVENYTTTTTPPTFRLGELTVTVESMTTIVPANRSLANGQGAVVFSSKTITTGPRLSADAIRIKDRTPTTGSARTELSGTMSKFNAANGTFEINGVSVDARNARVTPANQSLANNLYVIARGVYNGSGVLIAEDVRIRNPSNSDIELELKGNVTDYVSLASFKVRGVQLSGTGATLNNCGSGLANGTYVELKGRIDVATGAARATQIECKNAPGNATLTLTGVASNVNTTARTFTLTPSAGQARTIEWTTKTNFVGQLNSGNLSGQNVEVDGYTSGQAFIATKIKRKN